MEPTNELIERVWPDAYRIAYSIVGNHEEAEDAAQDACAKVHSGLHALRDEAAFPVWFYRIVVNAARENARRRKAYARADAAVVSLVPAIAKNRVDMCAALERLPLSQRMAVIFRYYYGFSDAEVARILGATHAAIRVRLYMARRALRRSLADTSVTTELEKEICHER